MMKNLTKAFLVFSMIFMVSGAFAQNILISDGGTVSTCAGTITDSGGPAGTYGDFEFFQITICSDVPGQCLALDFTTFDIGLNSDFLFIYDGPTTADPALNPAGYTGNLGAFQVSGTGDCLTFLWFTGMSPGLEGFEANIICAACPTCTDGIQNGGETGVDCGGGTCAPCPCDDNVVASFPFNESTTTCGAGNDYSNVNACFSFFMNGEDFVYEYTAAASVCLQIDLDYPNNPGAAGLFVTDGCPDLGSTNCILNVNSFFGQSNLVGNLNVVAGTTYYIIVASDNTQAPCLDFTINIDEGAPTEQDCLGAIPICEMVVDVPMVATGSGSCVDISMLNPSCLTNGELNSIWYTFGTANAGILNFSLIPNDPNDDFDWALYNITGGQCSDIIDDPSTLVSCNTYGVLGVNGSTGIGAAMGGFGTSNGPGNLNGPPFNDDHFVNPGETYAIFISNWSATIDGLTIDLTASDPGIFGFAMPTLNETITDAYCSLPNGTIDLSAISGGLAPYSATLNAVAQPGLVFNNLAPGNYDIQITSGSQCSFDYVLSLGDNFITTNAGEDTSICDLDVGLVGEILPGFTGSWSGPAEVTFDDPNSLTPLATSILGGNIPLTWTLDDGNGCVVTDEVIVTFTDEILVNINAVEESCYQYCDGSAEVLPSGGSGTTNYSYVFNDGDPGTNPNEVELLCPGTYSVTVIDENGCVALNDYEIVAAPVFVIEDIVSIAETCPSDCDGQLIVNAPMGINFSSNGGISFQSDSVLTGLCPGEYTVIAKTDENCLTDAIATVGVNDPPIADFEVEPSSASVFDANFSFINESEGGEGDLVYEWFFGIEGSSDLEDPSYTFLNAEIGEHLITLLLTDSLGCQDTLIRSVMITEDFHIFAPNSFSPDGDGVNEYFFIVGSDIDPDNFEMEIYDRWGHTIFESQDPEMFWDGSNNGGSYFVNNSTFVWRIKTKLLSSFDEVEMFGHVTLFR